MSSNMSFHIQNPSIPGWLRDHVLHSGVDWIKMLDPGDQNPFPETRVGVRLFEDDSISSADCARGTQGAIDWAARWWPEFAKRRWAHGFFGPNEAHPLHDTGFATAYVDFYCKLSELMRAEAFTLYGLCMSVGWPFLKEFDDPAPRAAWFAPAVNALYDHGHYISMHEYSAPAMWDGSGAYCLRIATTIKEWKDAGARVPYIFIGECGIDGGVLKPPQKRKGWKTFANEGQYLEQLAWYDGQLGVIPEILQATPFTWLPFEDWADFEMIQDLSWKLAQDIRLAGPIQLPASNRPPAQAPPVEPPIEPPPGPGLPAVSTMGMRALQEETLKRLRGEL